MALSGWNNKIKLTIDSSVVDSALTNFPVMIKVSASAGKTNTDITSVFDEVGSNSLKIAVATETDVECYVEIEKWDDTGEEAILWAKVPSIAVATDTILYLYYDNTHADNTSYVGVIGSTPGKAVWDANFIAVYHMSEDGGPYLNSTGTASIDMTTAAAPTRVSGEFIGYSQDFNGSQRCAIPDHNDLDFTTECTIELMMNIDSLAANRGVIMRQTGGYSFGVYSTGKISWGKNGTDELQSVAALVVDTDYHVAVARKDSDNKNYIYINGAEDTSGVKADFAALATEIQVADHPTAASWEMDGGFDEIRMSDIDRSAAWIKATKNSNYDTFITTSIPPIESDTIPDVTNWNIEENRDWYVRIDDAGGDLTVGLYYTLSGAQHDDNKIAQATGVPYGTDVPVILTAFSGYTVDLFQTEYTWHLRVTGLENYANKVIKIGKFTDLDSITHAIFRNLSLIRIKAQDEIDKHTYAVIRKDMPLATHIPDIKMGDVITIDSTRRNVNELNQIHSHVIVGTVDGQDVRLTSNIATVKYLEITR